MWIADTAAGRALLPWLAIAVGVVPSARAQETAPAAGAPAPEVASTKAEVASPWDWAVLPVAFYAPETSVGLGAGGILFGDAPADPDRPRRDDNLALFLTATFRKQFIVATRGERYLAGQRYKIAAEGAAMRFPNQFWGIGNQTPEAAKDTYTRLLAEARVLFSVQALPDVFVGVGLGFGFFQLDDVAPDGAVAAYLEQQPGRGRLGAGSIVLQRDTRDDTLAAHRGAYTELSALFYGPYFGGQRRFATYHWDQRQFLRMGRSVLSTQVFAALVTGDVPLDEVPALGGSSRLRGYFEGRYRDRFYVMAQTECRIPIFWRLAAVPFFGVGDVFPSPTDLTFDDLKPAAGLGLRLNLKSERELNLRVDMALGRDSSGFYVNLGEAF